MNDESIRALAHGFEEGSELAGLLGGVEYVGGVRHLVYRTDQREIGEIRIEHPSETGVGESVGHQDLEGSFEVMAHLGVDALGQPTALGRAATSL